MFEIYLNNANVSFIPSTCLRCDQRCSSKRRHICIVRHTASFNGQCLELDDDADDGLVNVGLEPIDLLILSKSVAIENNLLPTHVINQLRNSFKCPFIGPATREIIHQLKNLMLQELNAPLDYMNPNLPQPPRGYNVRAELQNELRALFRRARVRRENERTEN